MHLPDRTRRERVDISHARSHGGRVGPALLTAPCASAYHRHGIEFVKDYAATQAAF